MVMPVTCSACRPPLRIGLFPLFRTGSVQPSERLPYKKLNDEALRATGGVVERGRLHARLNLPILVWTLGGHPNPAISGRLKTGHFR